MKFKIGTKEFDIDDAVVTQAITEKKDAIELTAEPIFVRTKDEDDRFVENMKKDARKEGAEIAVKKTRETLGLTFEGKTIDNLVAAVIEKTKAESGQSETEAVKKLSDKVKEKDAALTAALSRATQAETSAKELKSSYKIDKALTSFIPANTVLPLEDVTMILRSKLSFKENETGAIEVYDASGNVIKNTQTSDPLPVKDVIENFFRENTHYIKTVDGGNGGSDSTKGGVGGKQSVEEFNKAMSEKGYQINSTEYITELNKAVAAKTIDID